MAVVHTDDFTVGSDTNLDVYGDWEECTSAGGHIVYNAGDRIEIAVADASQDARFGGASAPTGDQRITWDVTFGAFSSPVYANIAGRFGTCASGDYYTLQVMPGENLLQIRRFNGGSATTLKQETYTTDGSNTYEVKFEISGTSTVTLTGYIDGVQEITITDSSGSRHESGVQGLRTYVSSGDENMVIYDNLVIDDMAAAGGGPLINGGLINNGLINSGLT